MTESKYTAVIPVRAGSKRIKDKNIQPFADSNLLIHKIRQLKKVKEIDNIVVSSDSEIMLQMAKSEGVNIHKRELKYADDTITNPHEIIEYIVSNLDGEYIMWVTCVTPLLESETISNMINTYKNEVINSNQYDSLVSVKLLNKYIIDNTNYRHTVISNYDKLYTITNGFYMASKEIMLSNKYFLGVNPYLYEIDKISAIDIDDKYDLEIARLLYKNRTEQNRTEQNRTEQNRTEQNRTYNNDII
ncbi:acylneuraminate cytidylyltransferase family protein [Brachyspira intermedia]|uniref:acylneuraminate cytidylyltransferase family protein n=1 Tax=Brachyspira intermedia TaxID=84377 RepID=UPI003004AA75